MPAGVIVAGLNPYRPLDVSYAGFINLVAGQIASSIANARAYAAEKKRAEGLAEMLHKCASDAWEYGLAETLSKDEMIHEHYRGIRPAPGYPAQPDHTRPATHRSKLRIHDRTDAPGVG